MALKSLTSLTAKHKPRDIAAVSAYLAPSLVEVFDLSPDPEIRQHAVMVLANVALSPEAKSLVVAAAPLDVLLPALSNDGIRKQGERLLKSLLDVGDARDAAWSAMIRRTNLAPLVVKAAKLGSVEMQTDALRALRDLAERDDNLDILDHAGAVPVLLSAMAAESSAKRQAACAGSRNLTYHKSGCAALMRAGTIPVLVEIAAGREAGDQKFALSMLASLAGKGGHIRTALLNARVISVIVANLGTHTRADGELYSQILAIGELVSSPEGRAAAQAEATAQALQRVI